MPEVSTFITTLGMSPQMFGQAVMILLVSYSMGLLSGHTAVALPISVAMAMMRDSNSTKELFERLLWVEDQVG